MARESGLIQREIDRARKAREGGHAKTSGRWWSAEWWAGLHLSPVDACGAFADWETAEECHNGSRGRGFRTVLLERRRPSPAETVARRRASRSPAEAAQRQAYDEFLETRYTAASSATHGQILSKRGERRGVDPRRAFTAQRANPADYTEELRDWFRREGPTPTFEEYRTGKGSSSIGRWYDVDVTRAQQARRSPRLARASSIAGSGWR